MSGLSAPDDWAISEPTRTWPPLIKLNILPGLDCNTDMGASQARPHASATENAMGFRGGPRNLSYLVPGCDPAPRCRASASCLQEAELPTAMPGAHAVSQ